MSVVHRTYARSLFEAAKEGGKLAEAREQLGDFVEAQRQVPELAEILRNPQLDLRAPWMPSRATPTRSSATSCGS